jgi:hypothetical protein
LPPFDDVEECEANVFDENGGRNIIDAIVGRNVQDELIAPLPAPLLPLLIVLPTPVEGAFDAMKGNLKRTRVCDLNYNKVS